MNCVWEVQGEVPWEIPWEAPMVILDMAKYRGMQFLNSS